MPSRRIRRAASVIASIALPAILGRSVPAAAVPPEDPALSAAVEQAVDAGVEYLLREVEGPSGWCPGGQHEAGQTAVQLCALLHGGVSFRHPSLAKALRFLDEEPLAEVYDVSLDLMARDAVLAELEAEGRAAPGGPGRAAREEMEKSAGRIEQAAAWLVRSRIKGAGAWDYRPASGRGSPKTARWDNSNTQFAVLALGIAAARGIRVPVEIWEEVADHFLLTQEADGPLVDAPAGDGGGARPGGTAGRRAAAAVPPRARGWSYERKGNRPATLSMTAAGLSSVLLAARNIPPSRRGADARAAALAVALRDGLGWLSPRLARAAGKADLPPYTLYSIEKVGDVGGIADFGGYRWYEEFARILIARQGKDGAWGPARDEAARRSDTSLAILVLSRASDLAARSRPVLAATRAGGEGPRAGRKDEGWIHVRSLGGDILLGRLFRLLRYRPTKEVLRIAEEAALAEDPERADRLVVPLAGVLEVTPWPQARELAARLLGKLTGLEGRTPAEYREWTGRFREVLRIGKEADPAGIERLRRSLGPASGVPLRLKAIWALERIRRRGVLGDLIDLLEDPDEAIRRAAAAALVFISGRSIPFDPRGSEMSRAASVRAWREWWASEGASR